MPSLTITISAWWLVALIASGPWAYFVAPKIYKLLTRPWPDSDDRPFWLGPLCMLLGGPVIWVAWIWDEVDCWRTSRHNRKMREARGE